MKLSESYVQIESSEERKIRQAVAERVYEIEDDVEVTVRDEDIEGLVEELIGLIEQRIEIEVEDSDYATGEHFRKHIKHIESFTLIALVEYSDRNI